MPQRYKPFNSPSWPLSKATGQTFGPGPSLPQASRCGAPEIAGTTWVGETLTAEIGTIEDADGLPGTLPDDYTFQW